MPYTHFRSIAYEIPTCTYRAAPPGDPVVSGWDPGAECAAITRIPVADTLEADSRIRLRRLAAVVDLAEREVRRLGDDPSTLKIFIVPEFYLRPPTATGAGYHHDTYPDLVAMKILKAINKMFVHEDFSHWLFICGTVMWNTSGDSTQTGTNVRFFNTAIHVRGGRENALSIVEKTYPSDIDGVPVAQGPGRAPDTKAIFEKWDIRKQHIFKTEGISMGLEVCLDHLDHDGFRVLKKVRDDWFKNEWRLAPSLSFHILSAGGMPIAPASVAAKDNGYILRNDGLAHPGGTAEHSELQRITGHTGKAANMVGIVRVAFTLLPVGMRLPDRGAGYATFPQRIVFYPKRTLP